MKLALIKCTLYKDITNKKGSCLKDNLALLGILGANFFIYYAFLVHNSSLPNNLHDFSVDINKVLPLGLGIVLIRILNGLLSADTKARIVFLRWSNFLPGTEAFTRYGPADHRVDMKNLERDFGPLPTNPKLQNALWYQIYKSVEKNPSVINVQQEFLLARDYTSLALMVLVVFGIASFIQLPSLKTAAIYIIFLLVQLIVAGVAARNFGRRFVTTVLALKSSRR